MLKHLRRKFTLVLTLILSGALGAALAVQTASSLRQYRAGTDQVLHSVLQRTQTALDPWGLPFAGDGFDRDKNQPAAKNPAVAAARSSRAVPTCRRAPDRSQDRSAKAMRRYRPAS